MRIDLIRRKIEAPGVESFIFKSPESVTWKAGQFLYWVLDHEPADVRGTGRWLTIASAPHEKIIMLTTRLAGEKGSSFKKRLYELKSGEGIDVSDLGGNFTVEDPKENYVFIAGGIGITPFRSILKDLDNKGERSAVELIYANKDGDFIYKNELEALASNNPNLKIHYVVSPDRIDEDYINRVVPGIQGQIFYVSGPDSMVDNVGLMLKRMSVPKERVKQDWFSGYTED